MKQKIIPVIIGVVCLAIGLFAGYYGKDLINKGKFTTAQKIAIQDAIIKAQVQQADSMLETVYEGSLDGIYPLEQAKKLGADLLRNLRYGDDNQGYFWADTIDGTNVVLYGRKDVEGTNRLDAYVGGVYHVREIIKNGQKPGGGFTDYFYPKMDKSEPLPKRGFSLLFEPFGWVLGTGYYIEDLK
jgi:methyl-accepting chemotaxis protein